MSALHDYSKWDRVGEEETDDDAPLMGSAVPADPVVRRKAKVRTPAAAGVCAMARARSSLRTVTSWPQ